MAHLLAFSTKPMSRIYSASTIPSQSSSIILAKPPSPSTTANIFRFTDLPAELRIQVYEELLVVGKVFFKPSTEDKSKSGTRFAHWYGYALPNVQILRVSKHIHLEAQDVYLTKNLFVLLDSSDCNAPSVPYRNGKHSLRSLRSYGWIMPRKSMVMLKNVNISFKAHTTTSLSMPREYWDSREKNGLPSFDNMTQTDRMQLAHDISLQSLEKGWALLRGNLFAPNINLQYLEIDYTGAYCTFRCCHLLDQGTDLIIGLGASRVSLLGLRPHERNRVLELGLARWNSRAGKGEVKLTKEQLVKKLDIRFEPRDDIWARWRIAVGLTV
jgi:hypothetical protein